MPAMEMNLCWSGVITIARILADCPRFLASVTSCIVLSPANCHEELVGESSVKRTAQR